MAVTLSEAPPVRIAVVTEAWAPWVDGMVTRLDNTVRQLRRAGHAVLVIAPTTGSTIPGVLEQPTRSVRLDFLYGGRPWGLPDRAVARSLREFRPDVVHVVNPILMGAAAARHAAGRYPLVISYHTDVLAYAGHYHLAWIRPLLRSVMRRIYRLADVRLATSEVGRQQLGALGIGDVVLWPAGVERDVFHADRDRTRLRRFLGPEPGLPLALYVGRLAAEKGCARLSPLATAAPPVQLAFVGDGPDRDRLRRLFPATRVNFAGVLRGGDLADAYAAADVLVFPSTTDTLGLVLLEAMATGLPVVAADTPAARATLAGYPLGFLVPDRAPGTAWNEAVHATTGKRLTRTELSDGVAQDWARATESLVRSYRRAIGRPTVSVPR